MSTVNLRCAASLVPQWLRIHLPSRRCRFHLWVRKIPWRRKWQPTPVFLPGESHGRRSLVGYSPRCRKELDTISLSLSWGSQGKNTEVVCHSLLQWTMKVKVKSLSRVQLFVTPWTVAYQAPPSMGFSRQEYWSGLPLPSPE